MKLTKENIYVPLEGYSEEELTELYNFLESINEPCEEFLNLLIKRNKTLEFWDGTWFTDQSAGNKTPVTIEQLKEILQPTETFTPVAMKCTPEQFDTIKPKLKGLRIGFLSSFTDFIYLVNNFGGRVKSINNVMPHAKGDFDREVYEIWNEEIFLKACGIEVETFQDLNDKNMVDLMGYSVLVDNEEQARKLQEIAIEQGFNWRYGNEKIRHLEEKSFQFGFGGDKVITYYSSKNHYQDHFITKTAHFNDLFKQEALQEKEQRLLKELEEVRKEIEDSKIKVGDWAVVKESETFFKVKGIDLKFIDSRCKKITNPQLIELLENESK